MTEKHCLQCGVSIGETIKRYCPECRAKRDKENRRTARRIYRKRIENKSASELISINKANELHSEMVAFGNFFKAQSVVK